jgi:hypothetical protein
MSPVLHDQKILTFFSSAIFKPNREPPLPSILLSETPLNALLHLGCF